MVRHGDRSVRVLHNRCAQKGTMSQPARPAAIPASSSAAPIAWTFKTDGSLLSIPLKKATRTPAWSSAEASQGMAAVKDVRNHRGFVFCRLNPEVSPSRTSSANR